MSKQSYKVKIAKNGDISIGDVQGFGPTCAEATSRLEKFLGGAKENTRLYTDEYEEETINELHQEL